MRKVLIGATIGLAAAGVAALLGLIPLVDTFESKTYDWRIQWTADPASARTDIVLVAIDQSSVRNLEPLVGRWPWPRMIHASLVDYLARAPAKVIVYDVIFAERDRRSFKVGEDTWTGEESDRALAEATARAGNVVHVVDVAAEAGGAAQEPLEATRYRLDDRVEAREVATPPFPELAKASRALGHNLVAADPDGPVRRAIPFVRGGVSICRRCRWRRRSSRSACRRRRWRPPVRRCASATGPCRSSKRRFPALTAAGSRACGR